MKLSVTDLLPHCLTMVLMKKRLQFDWQMGLIALRWAAKCAMTTLDRFNSTINIDWVPTKYKSACVWRRDSKTEWNKQKSEAVFVLTI